MSLVLTYSKEIYLQRVELPFNALRLHITLKFRKQNED
jgi:hypothetical protein